MARYNLSAAKTTGAAAGLLCQIRAGSSRDLRIWEIGLFATTAVAGEVGLIRPTVVGSGFTSSGTGQPEDSQTGAGVGVIDIAATTPPTIGSTYMRRIQLPASVGAGVVWTFPIGINIPVSSSLALWQISTAAVGYDVYFVYDE